LFIASFQRYLTTAPDNKTLKMEACVVQTRIASVQDVASGAPKDFSWPVLTK